MLRIAQDLHDTLRQGFAGVSLQLRTAERRRLPHVIEDAAFRTGREAVVNAVRHAHPTRIDIRLEFEARTLKVTVQDDGRGFAPARVEGHCDVNSTQDGTTVHLEFPATQSVRV